MAADGPARGMMSRRSVLKRAALAGISATAAALQALALNPGRAFARGASADYGPLAEAIDPNTGLPLLKLPKGFRYLSFGITDGTMADGSPTPPRPDGMAVVREDGDRVTLVRNHELGTGAPFGPGDTPVFDAGAGGGTTNLIFDTATGRLIEDRASLTGTIRNCAGGLNPLNASWLTCEETTDAGHGYIFEVPARGRASAVPIRDAGRFSHEAVAVDPHSGDVYETEDDGISGFYRYRPKDRNNMEAGGSLQAARVARSDGPANLNGGNAGRNGLAASLGLPRGAAIEIGRDFAIEWVDIDHPDPGPSQPSVAMQALEKGALFITRGEGAWYGDGSVFFVSTDGGAARKGQIWDYDIAAATLTLVFESADAFTLNNPDNIAVAPSGGLLLCEDGGGVHNDAGAMGRGGQMIGLTLDGGLFPFAENNVIIPDRRPIAGYVGDQRRREWAGATFTANGKWLFANIQTPGITFAITGPWEQGAFGAAS